MALNGRLPGTVLGTIEGTNRRVLLQLVPQTDALRAAFRERFGKNLVVTDAYRDFDGQVRLRLEKGVWAAIPGTSNHGWGRAMDLGSGVNIEGSDEHRWMMANAPRFGWRNPLWARDNNPVGGQEEPWHWEASEIAVPVTNYTDTGGQVPATPDVTPPKPLEQIPQENHMIVYVYEGKVWLRDGLSFRELTDESQIAVAKTSASKVINVDAYGLSAARQLAESAIIDTRQNLGL